MRPNQTSAVAMDTRLGAGFQHARAQTLTAHFHQTKAADAAHLDACTVCLQFVFHPLFNGCVVAALFHVDEIDHDQTRQIAQAHLTRDFFSGFKVGVQSGLLNAAFFGGTARVHVNRYQRFGDTNDQIPTGFKLHGWVEHPIHEAFNLKTSKQRYGINVMLNVFSMRWHDHFHSVFGVAEPCGPFNQNFVNVAVVQIANGSFDQIAFFVNSRRCR